MLFKDGYMLATTATNQYTSELAKKPEASELLIKDLVNASCDSQSVYAKDYPLKLQFEDVKRRTQHLIDNLNPVMLKQYDVLLDCFKKIDRKLSNYDLFKKSYITYRSQVKSETVISIECAAYLFFLYR